MKRIATMLLGVSLGCSTTEVHVHIDADDGARERGVSVRVRVYGNDDLITFDQVAVLGNAPEAQFPLTVVISPKDDDAARRYRVVAELADASENVFNTLVATGGFQEGAVAHLWLRFRSDCNDRTGCGDGQTCWQGQCIGACFSAFENGSAESVPLCGPCSTCDQGTCVSSCGCASDSCVAGLCKPAHEVQAVATGSAHTCSLQEDRSVHCWGSNASGQVGMTDRSLVVTRPAAVMLHNEPPNATQISAGNSHTCVVSNDFHIYCWGNNGHGQLGIGHHDDVAGVVQVPRDLGQTWLEIALGGVHSCAIGRDRELRCWGFNDRGQLGIIDEPPRCDTEEEENCDRPRRPPCRWPSPQRIVSPAAFQSVFPGGLVTCGVSSSELWCWGYNLDFELGLPEPPECSSCDRYLPAQGDTDRDWTTISAGRRHTCGLKQDGRLLCWGGNRYGQLGDGATVDRPQRLLVAGDHLWVQVGQGPSAEHVCAVDTGNAIWCWGNNEQGQLGVRDALNHTPTRVVDSEGQWRGLSVGLSHTCAVRNDFTLWCWGGNESGQLGVGDTESRLQPTRVCFE